MGIISEPEYHALDKPNDAGISIRLVPCDKVYLGGGGIHCSTGPLVRDSL